MQNSTISFHIQLPEKSEYFSCKLRCRTDASFCSLASVGGDGRFGSCSPVAELAVERRLRLQSPDIARGPANYAERHVQTSAEMSLLLQAFTDSGVDRADGGGKVVSGRRAVGRPVAVLGIEIDADRAEGQKQSTRCGVHIIVTDRDVIEEH